ncbi:MAG: DUF5686 and carboxypeptidase regulatory-like domain-containing protein [Bacteroidales bacterium]|nr:DUF5686 and carboxypeptidase regulatory-like domain-containing protein [Bacteroidales bacterium]
MKKSLFLLPCVFVLCIPSLRAQYLTGRVLDRTQEPVAYATIYITELQQGVVANASGVFELAAPAGSYQLVVTCMGYQTTRLSWASEPKTEGSLKTIILEEAAYQIAPVYVTANREDPAYTIMRKAIGMAPYYRNIVESYTAEVYLKGTMQVTKLRGMAYLALNREQRAAIRDLSGIQESVSEIQFTAPDKYVQTIKSEKTAANVDLKKLGMGENDIQMGLANLNIYSNRPNMPLASNAFQNYAFKYLGDSEIDGQWVAKIQVTPRRKANDLFTGYLFIVREKWCVQSLDLSLSQQYIKAGAQQIYRFVSDDILLPVSYSIRGEWDGLGLGANGQFSGSIKYTDVRQNQRIARVAPTGSEPIQQAQNLLDKQELTQRDMRELRRIQDQAVAAVREEERRERDEKPSLEVVNNYRIVKDSLRLQQDSAYWALMRPAPLNFRELELFTISDSIKAAPYTPEGKRRKNIEIAKGVLGSGYTFTPDSLWRISYSGMINPFESSYNTVDGWVYGQALRLRRETKNNGYIQLRGRASWAFCRQSLMWNVLAEQRYWANRRGHWGLGAYAQTLDFAGDQGVGLVNEWSSLFFRINPARFYEGRGIQATHRIDIANGLVWNLGFKWEDRRPLDNHSDYSFFYVDSRSFAPNIPDNSPYVSDNPALVGPNRAAVIRMGISYTPKRYYRMHEGRKIMLSSDYPTFSAEWTKGIPGLWDSQSQFDFVSASVSQSKNFGYHRTIEYRAQAGTFHRAKLLHFADFHHIYTNQSGVSLSRDLNTFQLLQTYRLSTPRWYVQAHVRYQTPYLALKYIPIFTNPMIREGIQFSYLLQPNLRHYTELGYSMNIIMFNVGVFAGFEQAKYHRWGFRLSLPLELLVRGLRL